MMDVNPKLSHIESEILVDIKRKLDGSGVLYRLFSRVKSHSSLTKKLETGKYNANKKIQDSIGFRIAVYFKDDIEVVRNIIGSMFSEKSADASISNLDDKTFEPIRYNLIYAFPDYLINQTPTVVDSPEFNWGLVDASFEVQIRTMLSEGWHEVEHDLRYKCKEDWDGHSNSSRSLNGVYATLETAESSMSMIFEQLAYKHYQDSKINSMLRCKFRLRISGDSLSEQLFNYLRGNKSLCKSILKVERNDFVIKRINLKNPLPLNYDNIIYFINFLHINDEQINAMTPNVLNSIFVQSQIS